MRRRGRRRYNVVCRCSGGVLAVGALLESAPVLNFHGLGRDARLARPLVGERTSGPLVPTL
jgi:hypothetical protein